ncbi:hypothetical protein JXA88_15240 [Candidatus Fermentibacteria bacterium]|nr:hypothetical protein [Candidatus Fermentibacteria bacterium]
MDEAPDVHPESAAAELLRWRVHPAARHPRKATLVVIIILSLALASALYAGVALGVMACVLLTASLWPFFVPTDYLITAWGIEQIRWPTRQRRAWSTFRRFQVDRRGVLLSPFPQSSRLDPFRGMYVLTSPDVDVEAMIRSLIATPQESE